jgi:hypothetical protein
VCKDETKWDEVEMGQGIVMEKVTLNHFMALIGKFHGRLNDFMALIGKFHGRLILEKSMSLKKRKEKYGHKNWIMHQYFIY